MDKDSRIQELQQQLENVQMRNKQLEEENKTLRESQSELSRKSKSHSDEFWLNVSSACRSDPDYVRQMIANKTITMTDMNPEGQTLLILSTYYGSYELVAICLNLESDIKHKDNDNMTALDYAIKGGYPHIEQLLLFSEMNTTINNRIKQTSKTINKQNGINENIMKQLSSYDNTTKQFFQDTILDMMINIISNKLSFSDDFLSLCWYITSLDENNDVLQSDLWKVIKKTSQNIIQNDSKRDWFWFKTFLLPSTVWFQQRHNDRNNNENSEEKDDNNQTQSYLYYELFQLVDDETNTQLKQLQQNLSVISNKSDWNKLISWNIPNQYEIVRQDSIPNGLISKYSFQQLSEFMGVSATFNAHKFYDYHEYLPQLILLAQIVDDNFQKSVQQIFNVNKETYIGKIGTKIGMNDEYKYDEKYSDILYVKGPVKLIERARSKAENDYQNAAKYPSTSSILDFNRCSLIFKDVSTLLAALEVFINRVKYYESGNIIGICRVKNGFMEYVKRSQYADIKLNVLIKGKTNCIIGEVQLLLETMKQFKNKSHNLYSVQRQKEYVDNTVSLILPNLLDQNRQLFIAGNMGDVNALCGLMAINNMTEKDIMKIDETTQESILMGVVGLGHNKAYRFLKEIIDPSLITSLLFVSNKFNFNIIEGAIAFHRNKLIKDMFTIEMVKERYKKNKDEEFRLMWWLFALGDSDIIDFILSELNISNENMIQYMNYKYKTKDKGHYQYEYMTVMTAIAQRNKSVDSFKKLLSMIGEKDFVQSIFVPDGYNQNAFEYLISKNRLEMMEYIISFDDIKNECLENEKTLFRIVWWMNKQCDKEMYNLMVKILEKLDTLKMNKLKSYKYPKPKVDEFHKSAVKYWNEKITENMISKLLIN